MEKKQIATLGAALALFGVAGYILFAGGEPAPMPMTKRVVEVPPPALEGPVAVLSDRVAVAAPMDLPVMEQRRELQRQIETKALNARSLTLDAEAEKAKAEIASAKAAQAESRLRTRRADAAPLKEEQGNNGASSMANVPMTMPSQMPALTPSAPLTTLPAQLNSEGSVAAQPQEPKGLDGARLVMVSGATAFISVDGRTIRLRQGESSAGYRLAAFDQSSRAATLRDARGRTRNLYLDMTAHRETPELAREQREKSQPSVPDPVPSVTPTAMRTPF